MNHLLKRLRTSHSRFMLLKFFIGVDLEWENFLHLLKKNSTSRPEL